MEPDFEAVLIAVKEALRTHPPKPKVPKTKFTVYTNTKFKGHFPVGTAAVAVAATAQEAANLLNAQLEAQGLAATATADQFEAFNTKVPGCFMWITK